MASDGIILVTGGSRGIGAATAELLAQNGNRVVICDVAPEALDNSKITLWPEAVRCVARGQRGRWRRGD
jgi:NAD(P)-dependent dehydrogenase (short-subunit alcohol dehydrogenase family)